MKTKDIGFISCVAVAWTENDLQLLQKFSYEFHELSSQFEIIVCVHAGQFAEEKLVGICNNAQNLAIYEISTSSDDALFSAGLEYALGDWVLELPETTTLLSDSSKLIDQVTELKAVESAQLIPNKRSTLDKLVSKIASLALDVEIHTLEYTARLSNRSSLATWNARKLRSKVIRVAPQLSRAYVLPIYQPERRSRRSRRLLRIGSRTIIHSSPKPLRWISFISLCGASLALFSSLVILVVGFVRKVVPGWTTTNLQISCLSFLTLSVLGVLTEYIYQIAAVAVEQPTFRLNYEYLSSVYSFKNNPNIESRVSEIND